jgi:hypothetical protein
MGRKAYFFVYWEDIALHCIVHKTSSCSILGVFMMAFLRLEYNGGSLELGALEITCEDSIYPLFTSHFLAPITLIRMP